MLLSEEGRVGWGGEEGGELGWGGRGGGGGRLICI